MRASSDDPIAIIGSGCRFPGAASSPSKLWKLLQKPQDLSKKIPQNRFDPDAFYHPDGSHHGTTNVRHSYVLEEDHRHFDAQFFQIKPMEAHSIDPQQRILLETVYEAVEAAGLKLHDMQDTDTAVYVGVMGGDYNDLILKDLDSIPTYLSTGTARSILSNRISYFFDWHGPSMTIDTACSSSLVAVHQAVQVLQSGASRVAVAAGANLILGPENFIAESKLNMLSPNGRSRMWDAAADGYARGDGFGAVILKRLTDALSDGDDIECIIRGSGVNQDGRTKGITMPSSKSQASLIRQVYSNSGLDFDKASDRCQYFEAHGTGTPAGDPIEAAAIAESFFGPDGHVSQESNPLYVGSIKTVIGHTEGTAGIAGLLKASLAIRHGLIPPNLHLDRLNPNIEPFYSSLQIPTALIPWPAVPDGTPRRASINSFGFGGTNAHIILESHLLGPELETAKTREYPLLPFNFSATSQAALKRVFKAYLDYLRANPGISLHDLAYTLACRRSVFQVKKSIGASSATSLEASLTSASEGTDDLGTQSVLNGSGRILGVFTGQGAQWAGMGRDLILTSQFASNVLNKLENYLGELPLQDRPTWSLRSELLSDDTSSRLSEATLAQPLCTAIQIIIIDLFRISNVRLDAVVGHSSGEIAAAYAAGYLSDRDALYIAFYRGLHTRLAKGPSGERGAMMAVATTVDDAEDLCNFPEFRGRLSVAAVNSGTSITLSGDMDTISEAKSVFEDEEKFARILKVDKAYHSTHMNACSESYIASLRQAGVQVQPRPVDGTLWFSSVYGALLPHDCSNLEDLYWNSNMIKPVLFSQAIKSATKGRMYDIAVEIGPHPALQGPTLQSIEEAGGKPIPYTGMLRRGKSAIESITDAFGFIWAHLGDGSVDFKALATINGTQPRLLKDLPTFPWEHERVFWHESHLSMAFRMNSASRHELLGARLPDSTEQELRWRNVLSLKELPWLQGHSLQGTTVFPAAGYVSMALEAAMHIQDKLAVKIVEVQDLVIGRPITFDDETTGIETMFTLTDIKKSTHERSIITANFRCYAVPHKDPAKMAFTASGRILLEIGDASLSALPFRSQGPPNLIEVDTDRFYSALADLGYGYSGAFRGLSSMKRKLGASTGIVANPGSTNPESPFLVHPGMLDSAFQAVFLSYCWPGDGMLWSLHVPTHIARIKVNVELARNVLARPGELPFDCVLSPSEASPIHGDVAIYQTQDEDGHAHAVIQIEGMNAVPVSAGTAVDDRQVFQDVEWGVSCPNASGVTCHDIGVILSSLAGQVTFRYPHLHILELANSVSGMTQMLLGRIGNAFESYTLALRHTFSLDEARQKISHDRLEFKAFATLADLATKGLTAPHYGLAIVSGLEHEEDLESALRQLRLLVRPGAYLLMQYAFLSPHPISGDSAPYLSLSQYNSILRQAGFSGVDSIKNLDGSSVLTSQAVDNRVLSLRKPLQSIWTTAASQDAIIIGGASMATIPLAEDVGFLLQQHFRRVTFIYGLDSPEIQQLPSGTVIVSLTDLDEPTFQHLTSPKLEGLKRVFDQSKTVLWVTKGCLAHDPYANMIVGFGRTLLLETSYLCLQFLDFDPGLPITANPVANSLLRLQAVEEWSSSGGESGSDMVWTIEPELAMDKSGTLIIPRVLPSQDRNDRYNSSRRDISKKFDVKASIIELEYHASASSYKLVERLSPMFAQHSWSLGNLEIVVRCSSLLSLKIDAVGYLFLVLGYVVSTGERVLALSEIQASRISVPENWCVPCPEGITVDKEGSFLSGAAANLYAMALLDNARPHEVMLVQEPPPALEVSLSTIAGENHAQIHFLTKKTSTSPTARRSSIPWISLHPHASSRSIRSQLPDNISIYVTEPLTLEESRDDFQSRLASCLPSYHRRIEASSLWSRRSAITSSLSAAVDIRARLHAAAACVQLPSLNTMDMFALDSLEEAPTQTGPFVVDWTCASTVSALVRPVDAKPLFASDKTYFLVGLAGDLGQSLAKWMIKYGAKYIVLTSRNPRISKQWLESFEGSGATIKIYPNDITDKSALARLVAEIRDTFPPIAGVANGAMVLEDTAIADLSLEKMQKVLQPKVLGSIYLDALFGQDELDFFIFFSSVAAVVGNRGQSSYSAANAFMSSLAAQRRSRGLAASVIHIGAIVGTGYLTREVSQGIQDYLRKAGYMWMSEGDFLHVFAEGVLASSPASGRCHEIMSGLRMVKGDDKDAVWSSNPKFQHCVLSLDEAGTERSGLTQGLSVKEELTSAANTAEALRIITDAFVQKLRLTLLLDTDTLIIDRTADDLGIDSLVAVTIRSWFSKELNIEVPVMKILSGATIESILEYAVERLPASMLSNDSGSQVPDELGWMSSKEKQQSTSTQVATPDFSNTDKPSTSFSSSGSEQDDVPRLEKSFPMSFGQSRFWFLQSLLEDKATSNVTCLLSLKGPLRVPDLERAVRVVGRRHEGLRTNFFEQGGKLFQGILKTSSLELQTKVIATDGEVVSEFKNMEQHVFDLLSGDTMRIVLLRRSPTLHHLIVSYHHINMDGVSFMVLVTDMAKIYGDTSLSQPVLQYSQFSEQQRKSFTDGKWESQIAYWKHEFTQIPAPLPILPLSRVSTRKPMGRYDFHKSEIRISGSLRKRIQGACRKQKVTAFHFYVAIFVAMLSRFTGIDDLCVGIADAGRTDAEAFGSIGNFLNLLPLRLRPSASQRFSEILEQVRKKVYDALANAAVPVDVLMGELGVERSTMHSPLFQAFVDYRNVQEAQKFGNCEIEGQEYSIGRSGYDVALDVIDNTAGESSISIMVQKTLYTKDDAELLLKCFLKMAADLSDNPFLRLRTVSLYEKEQIDRALQMGRGPRFQHMWESLPHAVDSVSREHPARVALKDGHGNALTYQGMTERVQSIASALLDAIEIGGQNNRVAVFQAPSVDWICSMLAIMRIGATYVPLDLRSGLPRLAAIVDECRPLAILTHADTIDQVPTLDTDATTTIVNIDSALQRSSVAGISNEAKSSSPAIVLYTSGSTGTPKGIALSHFALQNQMEGCISKWRFNTEIVLQQSAYSFDLSVFQIYLPLLTGGTCYIVSSEDRGDAVAIARILAQEGITVTCGVPSEYITWLRFGDSELLRASKYKMMVSGGESFSPALTQELMDLGKRDLRAMNLYGPAEATISSNTIEVFYSQDPEALQVPAPSGHTVSNYSIYILDENLDPVAAGVPGQIAIAGSISSGYVNNDELDKKRFIPDPFAPSEWKAKGWDRMHLSGDRGRLRPSDGALIFDGRIAGDTQIKLRGIRIELQDIESSIIAAANGAIASAVASARGDHAPYIVAHVVFKHGHRFAPGDEQQCFLDGLRQSLPLPRYMRPDFIVSLDAMPLTLSGKIDRRTVSELPLLEFNHQKDRSNRELTSIEMLLKDIWQSITNPGLEPLPYNIDVESDFFSVGGNSLLLINLQARIKKDFGTSLSLLGLFGASTLEQMASMIDQQTAEGAPQPIIDWDEETRVTSLPPNFLASSGSGQLTGPIPPSSPQLGMVVVLTGATGFLGRQLLSSLLANPSIRRIHCIAVRDVQAKSFSDDRVRVYSGNLNATRLGLSIEDAELIFKEADTVIHNGADVSFLKTFASLRTSNVGSTKELIRILLSYRPSSSNSAFHYISTVGVAQFADTVQDFGPISAASSTPPINGSNGYVASKWASERYLERLVTQIQQQRPNKTMGALRILIHRPSSITGPDVSQSTDIVQSLLKYCRELQAVPENLARFWHGWVDLVDVVTVANGILADAISLDRFEIGIRYRHHSGQHQIPVEEMKSWLEEEAGVTFESISSQDWVGRARKAGIHEMVAAYLETRDERAPVFTPKILKEYI